MVCNICYEDAAAKDFVKLGCGCMFMKQCMVDFFVTRVANNRSEELRCALCPYKVTEEEIQEILGWDSPLWKKYVRVKTNLKVA